MKKWLKITLIILLVLFIAVAGLVIWQWENIKSIYIGMTESSEEITRRRNENQEKLLDDVDDYIDGEVRDLTDEEKEMVESGEKSLEDIYAEIFEEKHQEIVKNKDGTNPETAKVTKDEIVSKYMAQLYRLQSEYTAKAEVLIKEGASYYEKQKKEKDKNSARVDTINHFTPIVRNMEAECDRKVEKIISDLEKELEAIGENTDITRTIRESYAKEKQLKLSYYANKYLK